MKTLERERLRLSRKKRIKMKVQKQKSRHRLTVFRSTKHIYAQIVDDNEGKTLVASSSLSKGFKEQIILNHGSLLIMNPPTQEFWLHQIPPRKNINKERINLTFRFINV